MPIATPSTPSQLPLGSIRLRLGKPCIPFVDEFRIWVSSLILALAWKLRGWPIAHGCNFFFSTYSDGVPCSFSPASHSWHKASYYHRINGDVRVYLHNANSYWPWHEAWILVTARPSKLCWPPCLGKWIYPGLQWSYTLILHLPSIYGPNKDPEEGIRYQSRFQ